MLWRRRAGIFLSLCLAMVPADAATGAAGERASEDVVLKGKILTLPAALQAAKLGIHADAEPIARQVVMMGNDGSLSPLWSDEASRALFQDERLRDRPAEIHGKRLAGVPYIQVITFKIEQDGQLRTPEYYCNICTISVRYPQICPCCQGLMELRMKPQRP
jgi:hypothetical protein